MTDGRTDGLDGLGWNWRAWHRMEQEGMKSDGRTDARTERDGNGMRRNGLEWHGME